MKRFVLLALLLIPALSACGSTTIQRNESCIQERFGDIVDDGATLTPGFKLLFVSKAHCYDMLDQNFPDPDDNDGLTAIRMEAQTNDPLSVNGDVSVVYRFRPNSALEIYDTKGTEEKLEAELFNAIREGYRNGIVQYSIDELFSGQREQLAGVVQGMIQDKIGRDGLVEIVSVFVRDIKAPPKIEAARIEAATRDQMLDQERKQFQVDSIAALRVVVTAEAAARAIELDARAYDAAPGLLRLREIEAQSKAWQQICNGVQTCIIGGNVVDKFFSGAGG